MMIRARSEYQTQFDKLTQKYTRDQIKGGILLNSTLQNELNPQVTTVTWFQEAFVLQLLKFQNRNSPITNPIIKMGVTNT